MDAHPSELRSFASLTSFDCLPVEGRWDPVVRYFAVTWPFIEVWMLQR